MPCNVPDTAQPPAQTTTEALSTLDLDTLAKEAIAQRAPETTPDQALAALNLPEVAHAAVVERMSQEAADKVSTYYKGLGQPLEALAVMEGARVAAGATPNIVGVTPDNAQQTGQPTAYQQLQDHIASTIAEKKIPDVKKLEHATHIESVIADITKESASVPPNYREEFVRKEVGKRIGFRLNASVKGDIAEHIMRQGTRETITPASDTNIGTNAAGEALYDRADGSRYRMSNGRPDFGGDLAPVGDTKFSKGASESNGALRWDEHKQSTGNLLLSKTSSAIGPLEFTLAPYPDANGNFSMRL